MKKLILTFALLVQTAFLFASDTTGKTAVVLYDNVKMYRQAGTSTEVVKALKSSDELVVVRKHNANWSIVQLDGQVGYVLTSELTKAVKEPALVRAVAKK